MVEVESIHIHISLNSHKIDCNRFKIFVGEIYCSAGGHFIDISSHSY